MAQSAEATITSAVSSISWRMSRDGRPSRTSWSRSDSCPRPTRQGTHFPQVWAWQRFRKFSAISIGHRPGGLASIRCSMLRYRCSTTIWALLGVLISNRLMQDHSC